MRPKTSRTNIKKPYLFPFKTKLIILSLHLNIEGVQMRIHIKSSSYHHYAYYVSTMPVLCLLCLTMPAMPVLCLLCQCCAYYFCTMPTMSVRCLFITTVALLNDGLA